MKENFKYSEFLNDQEKVEQEKKNRENQKPENDPYK